MRLNGKLAAGIAGCAALAAAFFAGRLWAAGIPTPPGALTYTGALANPDGTPVTMTSKNIGLTTYDAAAAGNLVPECTVASSAVSLTGGQFQIALPDTCPAKIQTTANLWVEVQVDGASLGRTKLGAVPYAVEAGHAAKADSANAATVAAGLACSGCVSASNIAASVLKTPTLQCVSRESPGFATSRSFASGSARAACLSDEYLTGCWCTVQNGGVEGVAAYVGSPLPANTCACIPSGPVDPGVPTSGTDPQVSTQISCCKVVMQ